MVNKADREGSDRTISDLRMMLEMNQSKYNEGKWKPPILKAEAVLDKGVSELLEEIERQIPQNTFESAGYSGRAGEKIREELAEMVKDRLIQEVFTLS